ncbi:hypothetical protein BDV96DRAFT_652905 [Lophiotrema nucula]|uniref:DUF7932 domain-containing protein n=1 Tax=Lophiotrema nucula TaxID=690887 RepID=A0A6A5YM38_9PLEO|nr:hypothetical protein BDV96DRAFT_652905 [Lophiotrema nucula]
MQRYPSVEISVAGRSGEGATALVPASSLHGYDAPSAEHGQHADSLTVELVPSSQGGLKALYTTGSGARSSKRAAQDQDLFLNLRGGNGANGGIGGNGQDGYAGTRGSNATKTRDATPGGNGGRGGDGGRGSDGGRGGNGGNLELVMSEQNMHLVAIVDWDVASGRGGIAGRHGKPGAGGPGGRGGKSYTWQEHTGYRWSCSSECTSSNSGAVTTTRGSNSSNQVALSGLRGDQGIYFAFPTGAVSDGTNVAQVNNLAGYIPASIAPQFRQALLGSGSSSTDMALYNGGSGGGHASGCRQVKTYTSRHRPGAASGSDGRSGRAPSEPSPRAGRNGRSGTASIFIVNNDGTRSLPYSAKFEFQLVDFEVVDENNDAPHDAMPTPRRTRIPLRLLDSPNLTPRNTLELPLGIEPGETRVVQGEIWADISAPDSRSLETPLRAQATIKLEAMYPDIMRPVPHFNCCKTINIRHPLELVNNSFKFLDSLAPGTSTSVQWQIRNISERELGSSSSSRRTIKSDIQFVSISPAAFGGNFDDHAGAAANRGSKSIRDSRSHQTSTLSEQLHVLQSAQNRPVLDILVKLYLLPFRSHGRDRPRDVKLIQQHSFSIAVCEPWIKTRDAQYLILTSKGTDQGRIATYRDFIQKHLGMTVDTFDVSLYGGLRAESSRSQVLNEYAGKTILAMDDDLFEYSSQGSRSVLDFVNPQEAHDLSSKGTVIVSLQQKKTDRRSRESNNLKNVAQGPALNDIARVRTQSQGFDTIEELIQHLRTGRAPEHAGRYFIPTTGSNLASRGKRYADRLRKEFPLDRFVVTESGHERGLQIVHCHSQGETFSTAEVAQISNGVGSLEELCGLNPAEAYTCVSSLPIKKRLDILHESQRATTDRPCRYSDFAQDAAKQSVLAEVHQQVQAMASQPKWSDAAFRFKPTKHTTSSLFDSANDKIMTVLEHDIMLPPRGMTGDLQLSPLALELLSSIVRSARCQNFEQLMTKWFSPLKRTRSHVRKYLMLEVEKRIAPPPSTNEEEASKELKQRMRSFKRLKSVRQSIIDLNYRKNLDATVKNLTSGAITDTEKYFNSIENEMPKSQYLPSSKFGQVKAAYDDATSRRREDEDHHRRLAHELGVVRRHSTPIPRSSREADSASTRSSRRVSSAPDPPRRDELAASPVPPRTELEPLDQAAPPQVSPPVLPSIGELEEFGVAFPFETPTFHDTSSPQFDFAGASRGTEMPVSPLTPRAELGSHNSWANELPASPRHIRAELGSNNPWRREMTAPPLPRRAELEARHPVLPELGVGSPRRVSSRRSSSTMRSDISRYELDAESQSMAAQMQQLALLGALAVLGSQARPAVREQVIPEEVD